MRILLLPSLETNNSTITITNLSQSEAEMFISDFTRRVISSRKLKTPKKTIDDDFKIYRLIPHLNEYDIEDIAGELSYSFTPGHRGMRAVFVDDETDTIIVGTAVVYNHNWAIVNYDDDTLEDDIMDFEW